MWLVVLVSGFSVSSLGSMVVCEGGSVVLG